ncbi:GGDEF domain-containing protein [Nocardia panacis]|uniref:GGDEF domain-containing protein n=1 Tax=Nocardia panacis TaxID=2340916 RepID=A0A3A4KIW6_9NOCA|nr:GGDEF domain-containing protein [Nocardia panacis]RJO79810.1 GGDEF domain-containing protein [Nocardia panacis]
MTEIAGRLSLRWFAALLGGCASAVALALIATSASLALGTVLVVIAGAVTMIGIGLRRHRPRRPLPWYLLSTSAALFALGALLREIIGSAPHPVDDACTLAGYLCLGATAVLWLRPRRTRGDYDVLLDSALIGLGALLAAWTFLISPILRTPDPNVAALVVAVTYPVLDALLLTLVAHSMAATGRSETSLRLLHLGLLAVLVGDIGYRLETVGAPVVRHELLLAPLLLAYTLIGVAALHPTMDSLGAPRRLHPRHSRQRASMIAAALIVAALVPMVGAGLNFLDRAVISTLFGLLLIGVLVRSERAIVRSERSERRAQYQADHDMLTGLLNRAALLRTSHRETWAGQQLSLLFIDLDGFKTINDSFGHAVGDELIADAAARIRRVIRRADVAARYGGDEFVVLAALARPEAVALAQRLLAAFERPFELSAGEVPITASIGLACGGPRSSDTTVYDLIRAADSAMYHAKQYGRGYTCHDELGGPPATGHRIWRRERAV